MTTAEYLTQLIDSKEDMKSAIESKGVAVTGGLSTYADAISKIVADGSDPYSVGNLKFGYSDFEYAPYIDVYTDARFLFSNCRKLINIPYLDTSDVRYMHYMFQNCSSLTTIPKLNTRSVVYMYGTFSGCTSLTSIPLIDTSNVIDMRYMFQSCSALTTIPLIYTSNVTDMTYMFEGCTSLTSIPQLDTSKVTSMGIMFRYCSSLTTIPQLDTSKVRDIQSMFEGCTSLTTIPLLDASMIYFINDVYYNPFKLCTSLTTLGGFKDIGKNADGDFSLNFTDCPNITYESIMNVINYLYDVLDKTYLAFNLKLHPNTMGLLSDTDKAIATNKGWTLS